MSCLINFKIEIFLFFNKKINKMPFAIFKDRFHHRLIECSNPIRSKNVHEPVTKLIWETEISYLLVKSNLFEVFVAKYNDLETRDVLIIKPAKKYRCHEFEHIFGFKPDCKDYDENKVIALKKDNVNFNGDGKFKVSDYNSKLSKQIQNSKKKFKNIVKQINNSILVKNTTNNLTKKNYNDIIKNILESVQNDILIFN